MSRSDSRILVRLSSIREEIIDRGFPKPLAPLKLGRIIDENGFTTEERTTLRNAWRLIEPHKRCIGRKAFFSFLIKHEQHVNYFRGKDTKIIVSILHAHPLRMMDLFEILIASLEKPTEFHRELEITMPIHLDVGIHQDYMTILTDEIRNVFHHKSLLTSHMTPSLENGLNKLLSIVGKFNQNERERRMQTSMKYSMMQREYDTTE